MPHVPDSKVLGGLQRCGEGGPQTLVVGSGGEGTSQTCGPWLQEDNGQMV